MLMLRFPHQTKPSTKASLLEEAGQLGGPDPPEEPAVLIPKGKPTCLAWNQGPAEVKEEQREEPAEQQDLAEAKSPGTRY